MFTRESSFYSMVNVALRPVVAWYQTRFEPGISICMSELAPLLFTQGC